MALALAMQRHSHILPQGAGPEPPSFPWPHRQPARGTAQGLLLLVHGGNTASISRWLVGEGKVILGPFLLSHEQTQWLGLPGPGKEGCTAFHPTTDQVVAQREPWSPLHLAMLCLHSPQQENPILSMAARQAEEGTWPQDQGGPTWAMVSERRLGCGSGRKQRCKANGLAETSRWHPNKQDLG